jgi:hypothetical protein
MAKKGPIGKVEAFYIDNNYKNMTVAEIATDLDRTITSIESYIKKNHVRQKPTITVGDQFARTNGVTIMTENASSMSDEKRRNNKTINKPKTSCITKIK